VFLRTFWHNKHLGVKNLSELVVTNIHKSYGKHHVLKGMSFSLKKGEIVGFIGPNGSGKSTTMKCVANLIFPDSGEISIAGHDLFKARNQALSNLAALIEAPGLYFNLNGIDNLKLFADLRGVTKQRLDEVIEFTGLGSKIKMRAGNYSMGMKQRLALGIAILTKPTFLILDEPFSGLDPDGIFELREAIKKLAAEGCGIIFSSHQILEMEKISHRNIFIKDGIIIPHEEVQRSASMLSYRLLMEKEDDDNLILAKLKESQIISDYLQDNHALHITLSAVDHLSTVLSTLLEKGRNIRGITPVTADIENLYNKIYVPGA